MINSILGYDSQIQEKSTVYWPNGTLLRLQCLDPSTLHNSIEYVYMCVILYISEKKIVGLERGPLSLVSTTEELLDRKVAAPVKKNENTAVGIRHADHVAPSIRKSWQSLH
jgi:hypothetical protein